MRRAFLTLVIAACLAPSALGRPPIGGHAATMMADGQLPSPPVEPVPIRVSGGEHLAWEHEGASASDLEVLGFILTIDGTSLHLPASCDRIAGSGGVTCRAPFPPMAPGLHTLRVLAYDDSDGWHRSPPSDPIRILYGPALERPPGRQRSELTETTRDGASLLARIVADELIDPTDLAVLPDGRVLIAERSGRVRVFRDRALSVEPAVTLPDVILGDGRGLLALAADIEFPTTRAVWAVYTAVSGARLVRFTFVDDRLTDRAILMDGLPLAKVAPAVALRMGRDLKLYLALDDGGDPDRVEDLGSFSGKVLRLNRDGTTPDENVGHSPVYSIGLARPSGLAPTGAAADLVWIAGLGPDGGSGVKTLASHRPARPGGVEQHLPIPPGAHASDIVRYDGPSIQALQGSLLVATSVGGMLRIRVNTSLPAEAEWLFPEWSSPLGALGVGVDGTLYALTGTELVVISPAR